MLTWLDLLQLIVLFSLLFAQDVSDPHSVGNEHFVCLLMSNNVELIFSNDFFKYNDIPVALA